MSDNKSEGEYQESLADPPDLGEFSDNNIRIRAAIAIQQINDVKKRGRHYLVDGELVPSVTNVEGIIDKPALKFWAANIERDYVLAAVRGVYVENMLSPIWAVFEAEVLDRLGEKKAHQMRLKEAGGIGTELHLMVQNSLKETMGEKVTKPAKENQSALLAHMAWEEWAESVQLEPTHIETMVGSTRMGGGGTLDAAGYFNHKQERMHGVFDWKSSKRSQTSPNGIYPEALVQVCTYRKMAIEMGLIDDRSVAAVVRLPKNIDDPCLTENEPFDIEVIEPERADRLAEGFVLIAKMWTFWHDEFPK